MISFAGLSCLSKWKAKYKTETKKKEITPMGNPPLSGTSSDVKVAGVKGECTDEGGAGVKGEATAGGFGVWGVCDSGHGVHGDSKTSRGVVGTSQDFHGVFGKSTNNVGVAAESQNAEAVNAASHSAKHAAIVAINDANGVGVQGRSGGNVGILGESDTGRGVMGISNANLGVSGESQLFPGVRGHSVNGRGTEGFSDKLEGVVGISKASTGVLGISEASGAGVVGESKDFDGVFGVSHNPARPGVSGHNLDNNGNPNPGGLAGFFRGDVVVTGDVRLSNADCAEDFDISAGEEIEPGTVMVLDQDGELEQSHRPYDKKVAGVISGAGDYKPGITLDKRESINKRLPVALLGKVFCKVDAQFGTIEVGDLLTTSPTPGHAMKTSDPFKAFGAVIGKALRPLPSGQGLIPILIALQ
jgi:hypothetical protein